MSSSSIHELSTSEDEFSEPSTSSRLFMTSGYELHPRIIAMVRAQTFFGLESEDPDLHLQVFEELCSCLVIPDMSQETLRWKLFPFSLMGKAEQWYTDNVRGMIQDWEELRDEFCLSFSSSSHEASLRSEIIAFEQLEKESLGAAWARFSSLLASIPEMSIPDEVSLEVFLWRNHPKLLGPGALIFVAKQL